MKKIITLSLALMLLLTSLTSCFAMGKLVKKNEAKEHDEHEHNETYYYEETEPVLSIVEDTEEQEEEPVVLSDYLGDWHPSKETGRKELRIITADTYFVEFSLWLADAGEVNNVTAVVSGNTASFSMSDSNYMIAGKLSFEKSLIKLSISDSDVSFLSAGTITFDSRHSGSYQDKANAENENIVPDPIVPNDIVAPTHIVSPFNKYVNTPNNILYLRKGPEKSYEGIEKMPDRSKVEVYGYNPDRSWVYVYYYDKDVYGWCSDEYLVY